MTRLSDRNDIASSVTTTWHLYKIANAVYEVENGSGGFLGKPYEPNAVVKNDTEFVLMERTPGAYRKPTLAARVLSVISADNHQKWFQGRGKRYNDVLYYYKDLPFH